MANLSERIGRLISASVNAAVEVAEDMNPGMLMEQAIREVEEAITEVKAELGRNVADKHQQTQKLADLNNKHEELSGQIEVALSSDRDDLASAAVEKQLDLEAQMPIVEQAMQDTEKTIDELEGYIDALNGKRNEMREELRHYKADQANRENGQVIDSDGKPNALNKANAKIDKATAAFDRASSTSDVSDRKSEKELNELRELAQKAKVQERLEALKAARK